jgi:hypothetical protein
MPEYPKWEKLRPIVKEYTEMGYEREWVDKGLGYAIFKTDDGNFIFHDCDKEQRISSIRLYTIARVMLSDSFTSHGLTQEELRLFDRYPEKVIELGSTVGLDLGLINKGSLENFGKAFSEYFTTVRKDEREERELEMKIREALRKVATTY